jgi:sec-independent protein translocase protein TatC
VTPTLRVSEYLAFSAKLLLAFGLTFEMPIFAFFFTRIGLIDHRRRSQPIGECSYLSWGEFA